MKIGTDISLSICKAEGYTMMEFKKRELFTKGVLNPDAGVRFYAYLPEYDERKGELYLDTIATANEVWKRYQSEKSGIDSFAGEPFEFPMDEYDLLNLADTVNSYCGIN